MALSSRVALVKVRGDLYEAVCSVIKYAGGITLQDKRVLLKPNLVEPRSPDSGDITSPKLVEALIRYCQEHAAREIIVGDGPSYYQSETRLRECFTRTGISRIAEKWGVKWIIFDDYSYRVFRNFSRFTPQEFRLSEFVFKCDVLINLPVMKTHFMSKVTLGMKNLKGCLKREDKPAFHRNLSRAVVELNKIIHPDLNIVDGTCAENGTPILVAGKDIVAVDSVVSSIMGFNPDEVEMIKFAFEEGLGEMNIENIDIVGDDLSGVKMNLELPSERIKRKFPFLKLLVEDACCGCLIPILSCIQDLEKRKGKFFQPLRLVAGRHGKVEKVQNTIFIGDCTKNLTKDFWIPGCPPQKDQIKKILDRFFM